MIINKRIFLDYFLITSFIIASGVPYLSDPKINILLFLLMSSIFYLRKKTLNMSFLLFFIFLFSITLLQALKFDFFPIVTIIGLFTMVFNAYMIVKILDNNFVAYYVNVLYYIAIISFFFFFSFLLLPAVGNFFLHSIVPIFKVFNLAHSGQETILIYNLSHVNIFRNSGPFWEPGAFAGYLLIAFMLNFVKDSNIKSKKNVVFLLAIGTTISTTTFLALFVFLFFVYFKRVKNVFFKITIAATLLIIAIFAYTSLDFLGKKIEGQLEKETSVKVLSGNSRDTGRFITIIRDMQDFKGHEWIGRGINNATRYSKQSKFFLIRSVGLTDVLVKFGIIFFIIIIYFLYKSIYAYVSTNSIEQTSLLISLAIIIPILILLISEMYFNYSMYWSLLLLRYVYIEKRTTII